MAVKRTSDIIPLCHSGVPIEGISVNVEVVGSEVNGTRATGSTSASEASQTPSPSGDYYEESLSQLSNPLPPHGGVRISVRVQTTAKTGIEMEALAGVVGAGLTVVDMCKGVDRGLRIEGVHVVWKQGGRSGAWIKGEKIPDENPVADETLGDG